MMSDEAVIFDIILLYLVLSGISSRPIIVF